jgi:hypothetical protein
MSRAVQNHPLGCPCAAVAASPVRTFLRAARAKRVQAAGWLPAVFRLGGLRGGSRSRSWSTNTVFLICRQLELAPVPPGATARCAGRLNALDPVACRHCLPRCRWLMLVGGWPTVAATQCESCLGKRFGRGWQGLDQWDGAQPPPRIWHPPPNGSAFSSALWCACLACSAGLLRPPHAGFGGDRCRATSCCELPASPPPS